MDVGSTSIRVSNVIKSANQYPVHTLLGHDGNLKYKIPPYQRSYAWQKNEWEDLFDDLVEADGEHFLGTIITLNQTEDAAASNQLELIDGQQRMTTLTLLLAAIHSLLKEHIEELDDDDKIDVSNLGRKLVRKQDGEPRVQPQIQDNNKDDYVTVLAEAGLKVEPNKKPYYPLRRIPKAYQFFRTAIIELAIEKELSVVDAAKLVLTAAEAAVIVKIEVASHADAFVLFESLNNRGTPLTPVDLIKNHLFAEAERKQQMKTEEAFKRWNEMLTNLGDDYANHERFLRHYYNAFKTELPSVPNAPVATRTNLIRIYEVLLTGSIREQVDALIAESKIYGRVTGALTVDQPTELDQVLKHLTRAQGAPSYVLLMWLLSKSEELELTDAQLVEVAKRLISFFVRRNLTGFPQTYSLPKLFMGIIARLDGLVANGVVDTISSELASASASDDVFRERLEGPIYDENTDVTRFVLSTLAEDSMTKESWVDLWARESGRYTWTIEHIFPQGENIPKVWQEMLGGAEVAKAAQDEHVHRLGNLTITAYNSNLGNKSFIEKRDRTDTENRPIGYKNGLILNQGLAVKDSWTVADISARTELLASQVIEKFPLR